MKLSPGNEVPGLFLFAAARRPRPHVRQPGPPGAVPHHGVFYWGTRHPRSLARRARPTAAQAFEQPFSRWVRSPTFGQKKPHEDNGMELGPAPDSLDKRDTHLRAGQGRWPAGDCNEGGRQPRRPGVSLRKTPPLVSGGAKSSLGRKIHQRAQLSAACLIMQVIFMFKMRTEPATPEWRTCGGPPLGPPFVPATSPS